MTLIKGAAIPETRTPSVYVHAGICAADMFYLAGSVAGLGCVPLMERLAIAALEPRTMF